MTRLIARARVARLAPGVPLAAAVLATGLLAGCARSEEAPPIGGTLLDLESSFGSLEGKSNRRLAGLHARWLEKYVSRRPLPADIEEAFDKLTGVYDELDDARAVLRTIDRYRKVIPVPARVDLVAEEFLACVELPSELDRALGLVKRLASAKPPDEHRLLEYRLRLYDALVDEDRVSDAAAVIEAAAASPLMTEVFGVPAEVEPRRRHLSAIGKRPPQFSAETVGGTVVNLHALQGKVVLIVFWATWSGSSRDEMPGLVELYGKHKDDGFEIIGVNEDEEEPRSRDLRAFLDEEKVTWPQIVDRLRGDDRLDEAYEIGRLPHTVLLDRKGKIHRVGLAGDSLARAVGKLTREPRG